MTPTPSRTDQCEIALWRGYATARFYARRRGRDEAIFFSPAFPTWRLPWQDVMPMSRDPVALAALSALEATLRNGGWERMRRAAGSEWYELRFRPSRSDVPRSMLPLDRPRADGTTQRTEVLPAPGRMKAV